MTPEQLYEALKNPVLVRTAQTWAYHHQLEAPPAAIVILRHPARPEIDAILEDWPTWNDRRQQGFCRAITTSYRGAVIYPKNISAYRLWKKARTRPLPVAEMIAAMGAGAGGQSRLKLQHWRNTIDYVEAHAIKLPTNPPTLYPMADLIRHLEAIPELKGWWGNKQHYGELSSHPWLDSGIKQLWERMGTSIRVARLSRGD